MTDKYTPPVSIVNEWNMSFYPAKVGDVGHDLYATQTKQTIIERFVSAVLDKETLIVWPWCTRVVSSGVKLGLPNDTWAMVVARSSTMRKRLIVLGGIIDSGYRGELFTVLANFSFIPRLLTVGERYSQVLFYDAVRPTFGTVTGFTNETARGATGFGSSGK